jgi:hypothetical protein
MKEQQTPEEAPKAKRAYKSRGRMSEAEKLMRDLDAGYKHNRKMIEKSMEECSKGTNTYLAHVKALDAQLLEYARFRREIGMLPKSVTSQTTTEYIRDVSHLCLPYAKILFTFSRTCWLREGFR